MTDDPFKTAERLEKVAEFGGTHLDGLWTEAAAAIRRLVEERDDWRDAAKSEAGRVDELQARADAAEAKVEKLLPFAQWMAEQDCECAPSWPNVTCNPCKARATLEADDV